MIICEKKKNGGGLERHEAEEKLCAHHRYLNADLHKNRPFTVDETDSAFKTALKLKKWVYGKMRVTIRFYSKPM